MIDATEHAVKTHKLTTCLRVTSGAGQIEIASQWPMGALLHTHVLTEDEALALAADIVARVEAMRKARDA